ncbi:hypothetical protein [Streptomyces sp. NTH33]|uniref:hypothetical protein n=1 Tax=Streptomyces sp. NTH33 TaxID=1735453 RepID=UPI0015E8E04E|nr:hypothetical protein [Streptomyces sp. NTH33]
MPIEVDPEVGGEDEGETPGALTCFFLLVGGDVRLVEAGPAVIAEVFSRSHERELFEEPGDDPHCAAVVNLIH